MGKIDSKDILSSAVGTLGIGGNIASTLLSNEANKSLMRERNQMAIEQWQRENEYNLPKNQVERLLAAGLNPALMYENGASGLVSATSPDMKAAQVQAPQVDPLTMAQINNINAQTKNIDKDTEAIDLNNFNLSFQNDFLRKNDDDIKEAMRLEVQAGRYSSYYELLSSFYSAARIAALFSLDIEQSEYLDENGERYEFYNIGDIYYDKELHDKFKSLGLGALEQERLEQALYKSYQAAQMHVNKRSGEVAKMEVVIPEMINGAPKWLKPILVLANSFLHGSKLPAFNIGNKTYNQQDQSRNEGVRKMFFFNRRD